MYTHWHTSKSSCVYARTHNPTAPLLFFCCFCLHQLQKIFDYVIASLAAEKKIEPDSEQVSVLLEMLRRFEAPQFFTSVFKFVPEKLVETVVRFLFLEQSRRDSFMTDLANRLDKVCVKKMRLFPQKDGEIIGTYAFTSCFYPNSYLRMLLSPFYFFSHILFFLLEKNFALTVLLELEAQAQDFLQLRPEFDSRLQATLVDAQADALKVLSELLHSNVESARLQGEV